MQSMATQLMERAFVELCVAGDTVGLRRRRARTREGAEARRPERTGEGKGKSTKASPDHTALFAQW
eukprot:4048872-Pleurochrysis_carterae.AAC.1